MEDGNNNNLIQIYKWGLIGGWVKTIRGNINYRDWIVEQAHRIAKNPDRRVEHRIMEKQGKKYIALFVNPLCGHNKCRAEAVYHRKVRDPRTGHMGTVEVPSLCEEHYRQVRSHGVTYKKAEG